VERVDVDVEVEVVVEEEDVVVTSVLEAVVLLEEPLVDIDEWVEEVDEVEVGESKLDDDLEVVDDEGEVVLDELERDEDAEVVEVIELYTEMAFKLLYIVSRKEPPHFGELSVTI